MYEFLEEDFGVCTEYVELDERNFGVYSFRLADLIIRTGPEILRLFNLILFNPKRKETFLAEPSLERKIMRVQRRKDARADTFNDYLSTFSISATRGITGMGVEVRPLGKFIVPFETESRFRNGREVNVVSWWEDGYNALRHRVIEEFSTSATLKHALFSLAGLWTLHNTLDYDWGTLTLRRSDFFGMPFAHLEEKPRIERLR